MAKKPVDPIDKPVTIKPEKTYRVLGLHAENVKRISVVDIKPDGNVVEITGKNGSGKTSVLDALWWAIEGAEGIQSQPIRKGADKAKIEVNLGDIIVRRTFNRQDPKEKGKHFTTSVIVENAEGFQAKSPQAMLDALLSKLSFDPLAFKLMEPKKQFELLRSFVPDFDFSTIDQRIEGAYAARTEFNRKAKEARLRANAIVVPDELPMLIGDDELLADLGRATDHNAAIEVEERRRGGMRTNLSAKEHDVKSFTARLEDARRVVADLERQVAASTTRLAEVRDEIERLPILEERIDSSALTRRLSEVRAANAEAERVQRDAETKKVHETEAEGHEAEARKLTERIEDATLAKQKAIAEADLPLQGIGFGDGIVLLNDQPFEQASDAEQLRASVAMAMALNPKLRVIRIRDGSLLDEDSMVMLAKLAEEKDFQVFIETVNSGRAGAVIMEDGHVAGVPDVKPVGAMV